MSAATAQSHVLPPGVCVGDSLFARKLGRNQLAFDSDESRYLLLVVLAGGPDAAQALASGLPASCAELCEAGNVRRIVAAPGAAQGPDFESRYPGCKFIWEAGDVVQALLAAPEGNWFLTDAMYRVVATGALAAPGEIASALAKLDPERPSPQMSAPLLMLPGVFEPAFCEALIRSSEADGGAESGFMGMEKGERTFHVDYRWKRRQDYVVKDPELATGIMARVGRRVCPEIKRAFQCDITRMEHKLVARYDGDSGGHFGHHRDDSNAFVRFRRFALSLPLNDDYEGGELTFPEFGPRKYRPAAGCAVVFSVSLLHRLVPVTKGHRYACLSFLFDEAGEKQRVALLSGQKQSAA